MSNTALTLFSNLDLAGIEIVNPRKAKKHHNILWADPLGQSGVTMRTMYGMNTEAFYLIRARRDSDPEEWKRWMNNQSVTLVECDLTPTAQEAVMRLLPEWYQPEIGQRAMGHENHVPAAKDGRYFVREYVCDNFGDTLFYAMVHKFPLNLARFEPGPTLVYANRQSRFTGNPFSLWSDGKVVTTEFNSPIKDYHGEIDLSPAAAKLLSYAVRQRIWRENDAWKPLLLVGSYETAVIKREERRGFSSGNEYTLARLTTDSGLELFLVTDEGAAMGEDGDAWKHCYLYTNLVDAEASYQEVKNT
jgi:hypothetical protein